MCAAGWTGAEDVSDRDPRFPVIPGSPREVITVSRHSRKPQSRLVLVLQAVLALAQVALALTENAATITHLLGDLW